MFNKDPKLGQLSMGAIFIVLFSKMWSIKLILPRNLVKSKEIF